MRLELSRTFVGGWQKSRRWFASTLRRSSLDEEVVVYGGQAWPAYQIREVFWSCSSYEVLAFEGRYFCLTLATLFYSFVGYQPFRGGGVLIGLRGDTHQHFECEGLSGKGLRHPLKALLGAVARVTRLTLYSLTFFTLRYDFLSFLDVFLPSIFFLLRKIVAFQPPCRFSRVIIYLYIHIWKTKQNGGLEV